MRLSPRMGKGSFLVGTAVALFVSVAVGCTGQPAYICESNTQCISTSGAQGVCESTKFCSFPDSACAADGTSGTGRRYGSDASNGLASQCVPMGNDCIQQIAVGIDYACVLKTDGTVWCWGANDSGQLGNGTMTDTATPTKIPNLTDVTEISAAEVHACALKKDHTVVCWGADDSKQLGQCDPPDNPVPNPVVVQQFALTIPASGKPSVADDVCVKPNAPFQAQHLSSGGEHNCAIGMDGQLYCWGENSTGSTGGQSGQQPLQADGTGFDDVPGPTVISGGFDGPVQVKCGDEFSCVLRDENSTWCFGSNSLDSVGNSTALDSQPSALQVTGVSDATSLVLDDDAGCVVTHDGSLYCWGNGATGIFGSTTNGNQPTAKRLLGVSNAFAGPSANTVCVTQSDNSFQCFGSNNRGQTGTGSLATNILTPTPAKIVTVKDAALGQDNTCAKTTDGALWCWGDNSRGQLGQGSSSQTAQTTPVRVPFTCP